MTSPSTDDREAGFTIIEVLIALALVAVSLVAIGSLMATNVRGVRSLEQHVSLAQAARAAMAAGLPARADLQPGTTSGQLEGYHWTVDQMEPEMAERLRNANLAWIRSHNITSVETNVIYAVAFKP